MPENPETHVEGIPEYHTIIANGVLNADPKRLETILRASTALELRERLEPLMPEADEAFEAASIPFNAGRRAIVDAAVVRWNRYRKEKPSE